QFSDFSSMEGHAPPMQSYKSKILRRLAKPFTEETPGSYEGWTGWTLKPFPLLQLEAAVVSANGGALAIGLNPFPNGRVEPAEIQNLSSVWGFIQKREAYFLHTQSAAEIGVFLPPGPVYAPLAGLHEALLDHQIDYAVITDDADWEKYTALIVP